MTRIIPPQDRASALAFWSERTRLSRSDFYALSDLYRVRAFSVTGLQRLEMIEGVRTSLRSAIAEGQTFNQWKESVGGLFERQRWTGLENVRLQTVFRNNLNAAYHAGRWQEAQQQILERPYGMYATRRDRLVRPTHRAQDRKVYRLDNGYWLTWWPPNGHNCRCRVDTFTLAQIRDRGYKVLGQPPGEQPDPGFAANSGTVLFPLPLSRYTATMRQTFLRRALQEPAAVMTRFLIGLDSVSLRTVRWADEQGSGASFGPWARGVIDRRDIQRTPHPLGDLPAHLLNRLPARGQPRLALAFMRSGQVNASNIAVRRARGRALTDTELRSIRGRLEDFDTRWYVDRRDPRRLIAISQADTGFFAIRVDENARFGRRGARNSGVANEVLRVTWQDNDRVNLARFRRVTTNQEFMLAIAA